MTLPKLLCIGAQKSGTSWLHENLANNPGIWVAPFKELHFFDHKFIRRHRRWTPGHVDRGIAAAMKRTTDPAQRAYLDSLRTRPILNGTWYKRVFAPCPSGTTGFDATPEYASLPDDGIAFLRRFLGADTRIIYLIRDPLDRALSQLRMNIARHRLHPETSADWARLALDPDILDRGNYAAHIPRWDRAFGTDQILYIPFGDIDRAPKAVLRRIEKFGDLPQGTYPLKHKAVFRGPQTAVPAQVIALLRDQMHPQLSFLKMRFGVDFADATNGRAPASPRNCQLLQRFRASS